MKIIGITGGIGCGKSQLLALFDNRKGVTVCSADQIGKELQARGQAAYAPILEAFGTDFRLPDGELDRKALAERVFGDEKALSELNAIVHPLVHEEVLRRISSAREQGDKLFLLESAILLDVGYQTFCEEVWALRASAATRKRRLKEQRGMGEADVERIMIRQRSDEAYAAECDRIIDNDGGLDELKDQVNRLLSSLGLDDIRI